MIDGINALSYSATAHQANVEGILKTGEPLTPLSRKEEDEEYLSDMRKDSGRKPHAQEKE